MRAVVGARAPPSLLENRSERERTRWSIKSRHARVVPERLIKSEGVFALSGAFGGGLMLDAVSCGVRFTVWEHRRRGGVGLFFAVEGFTSHRRHLATG